MIIRIWDEHAESARMLIGLQITIQYHFQIYIYIYITYIYRTLTPMCMVYTFKSPVQGFINIASHLYWLFVMSSQHRSFIEVVASPARL